MPRTTRYGRHKFQRVNLDTNVAPVIPGVSPQVTRSTNPSHEDYQSMTVDALKSLMDMLGIDRTGLTRKADLITALEAVV